MVFEVPKNLEQSIPDAVSSGEHKETRVRFLASPFLRDGKPQYHIGACMLKVNPGKDSQSQTWFAQAWNPKTTPKFQPIQVVSNTVGGNASGGPLNFNHTRTKSHNTKRVTAEGTLDLRWTWNTEDEEERQTGYCCERIWMCFESASPDEPQSEVTLTCRRILSRAWGNTMARLLEKFPTPASTFLPLRNFEHELKLIVDWSQVPRCKDDTEEPRARLDILSNCIISGRITCQENEFPRQINQKLPFVVATQSIPGHVGVPSGRSVSELAEGAQ
jgi:hypothetical protein